MPHYTVILYMLMVGIKPACRYNNAMSSKLKSFDDVHKALADFVPATHSVHHAYTLTRIRELMEFLGNPQDTYQIIHVAGTSGKTSTSYYLAGMLKEAGKKVGLTVSPHIDEVNERVQINLKPLAEAKFCSQLQTFLDLVEKSATKPTYHELLIAFAYWVFARDKVDYAVIEVGLGGLLDSTNVINRPDKICVITDIGLDHTAILGRTLPEIASQKAGIIKPHNAVFMHSQSEAVMEVVREVCSQQQAELQELHAPAADQLPLSLPLFQRRNWFLAFTTFLWLRQRDGLEPLDGSQLTSTTRTYVPARMEVIRVGHRTLIMDGAHNSQKLEALVSSIRQQFPGTPAAILLSMAQGKGPKLDSNLKHLRGLAGHVIITAFKTQQDLYKVSVDPLKIAAACDRLGFKNFEVISDPEEAYAALLKRPEPLLLITGSFYLISHIRQLKKTPKISKSS